MRKNILLSNRGNSLVMVLVAAGLSSVISLVIADMMNLSLKSSNVANNATDFELIAQDINFATKSTTTCAGFAKDASGNNVSIPAAVAPVPVDRLMSGT